MRNVNLKTAPEYVFEKRAPKKNEEIIFCGYTNPPSANGLAFV